MNGTIRTVSTMAILLVIGIAIGLIVSPARHSECQRVVPPKPKLQPAIIITFRKTKTKDDVIEFDYAGCWVVVNAKKKTFYQTCSDIIESGELP